jgi:uncharacterized protein YggL (DUF469 family)
MKRYAKSSPRLTVKFLDGETNELLFEVNDRNHMNVGDIFTDTHVSELINRTIKAENLPESVNVMVIANFA